LVVPPVKTRLTGEEGKGDKSYPPHRREIWHNLRGALTVAGEKPHYEEGGSMHA